MKHIAWLLTGLLMAGGQAQNVPVIGTDSTIEVANWNLQWFGNTSYGPSNEATQLKNIAAAIEKSKMDVWGLCEVCDTNTWDSLLVRLPEYKGILSTWSQTQKTALLYNKTLFRHLYTKHPLTSSSYDFAGGRLPLEVALEANMGAWKDTFVFFVIHLKSNVGTDPEKTDALERRNKAAIALKAYIEGLGSNRKCMVIGDWNDDLDKSVFAPNPTPFQFWLNDSADFNFPTRALTLAGEKSMEAYTEVIDHQCVYGRMMKDGVPNSAKVFYLNQYITGYASNTSDHYPVYSFLKPIQSPYLSTSTSEKPQLKLAWNGTEFILESPEPIAGVQWLDLCGREVAAPQRTGCFILTFEYRGKKYTEQMFLNFP